MKRARSSSWLLLSLVALSTLVLAELRFDIGRGHGGQAVGRGGGTPEDATPVPQFSLADRDNFTETVARPLFTANRRPLDAAPAPSPVPTSDAARPNADRYALSAIIIVDDERIALLKDTATGSLTRVREGESVADWQVESIHEGSAVLRNGETRAELSLRTFGPPAAPPSRRRTRAGDPASGQGGEKGAEQKSDRSRSPGRGPRQSLKRPRLPGN